MTVKKIAQRRLWRAYGELVRDGSAIDPDGPVEPLHALRIRGKKLRYLMGFFAQLFEERKIALLQPPLKELQDVLGTLNDLFVQQQGLRASAVRMTEAGKADVDTLLAIGRLSQVLSIREAQTRLGFVNAFEPLCSPSAASAYKLLFKP